MAKCLNCKHKKIDTEGIRLFKPKLKEYKEKLRRHEEFIKKIQNEKDRDSIRIIKE